MAGDLKRGNSTAEQPLKEVQWMKMTLFLAAFCTVDIAVHYQYIPVEKQDIISAENKQGSHYFTLGLEHSFTANILWFSSICRAVLLFLLFRICEQKCIPKFIQPHIHYVTMTMTFIFCSITMWRLLLDSEPPNSIFYFGYLCYCSLDVMFTLAEYVFNRHVIKQSGAVGDDALENEDTKRQKRKKKKKKERTVPFLTMVKKLTFWYTSEWLPMVVAYSLMTIRTFAKSIQPYLNSQIIDAINSETPMTNLPTAVLLYSMSVILEEVVGCLMNYVTENIEDRISLKAKSEIYKNVLKQEVGFFDETKSGKILKRVDVYSSHQIDDVWRRIEYSLSSILNAVGLISVMMTMSWRLTVILIAGNYVLWLPENMLANYYRNQWQDEEEVVSTLSSMASETVRNIRTVKSFANEELEANKYKAKLEEHQRIRRKDRMVEPALNNFEKACWLLMRALILIYGGHLLGTKELSPGSLVIFLLYMEDLWYNFSSLLEWQGKEFFKMLLKLETFFEYFERKSKLNTSGNETTDTVVGKLEFKGVSFKYPTRSDSEVLKDVSFTAEAGKVVALVGSSGGGKSTCVNLIERFYDPVTGSITLDDKPLESYNNTFLHRQIALVSQEPVLFAGSIEENIKYGNPDASHEEVVQAGKDANAHDFICALDDGYETDVGEAGTQMSGGQKQRIAIARALITNPKIMLLDEATSALDAESESLVQEALHRNMEGRTVIIIAHRLSTVKDADKIVVIDKGTVVEQGTHDSLLLKNGVYSKLVRKQLKSSKPRRIDQLLAEDNDTDAESSSQASEESANTDLNPRKNDDEYSLDDSD